MKIDLKKARNRIAAAVVAANLAMVMPMPASAVTIKDNLDAQKIVGNLLDWLLTAGQLVGGGVIIYAFIAFAQSIFQENPDQRSRAIMFFVGGAMLVGIKPILKSIGIIA